MKNITIIVQTFLSLVIILTLTTVLYLYSSGYRLINYDEKDNNNTAIDFSKTGMIGVKSIPNGASVYLDGKVVTATNDNIPGLEPGKYDLKVTKKGFVDWTKEVEVYRELVTDITAVLVSQTPRLEPLTNTGAASPSISPSLNSLAYFSKNAEKPGIWIIPLNAVGLNLFRTNPDIAIEDTRFSKYSEGKSIEWSPDEKSLLIEGQNGLFYEIDLELSSSTTIQNPELLREEWKNIQLKKRQDLLDKITLEIPDDMKKLAISNDVMWAPDDKKFLYKLEVNNTIEYRVYNLEDPLPVGEKVDSLVFTINKSDAAPFISWYTDSFHLLLVEGDIPGQKRGLISLIRIDGTNKTEIYNNSLHSNNVYSTPSGDKMIILTSFKSGDQTDLYTLGIR